MFIYKITNLVNGMVYIGQTIQSISTRWNEHTAGGEGGFYLHNAIRKYGKDNFRIEEICVAYTQTELDFLEVLFITALHSTDRSFGYNLRDGGSRGAHSLRSKQLMSIIAKGKPKSEEHKKNIGLNSKENWQRQEYREKQLAAHKNLVWKMTPARKAFYESNRGKESKLKGRPNPKNSKPRTQQEKDHLSAVTSSTTPITNGIICKRIPKTTPLPEGWYYGTLQKKRIWITNGVNSIQHLACEIIPEGWQKGRISGKRGESK